MLNQNFLAKTALSVAVVSVLANPGIKTTLADAPKQSKPAMQSSTWLPTLGEKISEIEADSHKLDPKRAKMLSESAVEIAKTIDSDSKVALNFICTHNSRRSHLSQIWATVAADRYDVKSVGCFSGGTESTACNPRIVRSLRRTGFSVVAKDPLETNPHYWLQFAEQSAPVELFSKKYDCDTNPSTGFFAMMCCSDADEKCPLVHGAVGRVALHYQDPKKSDGTAAEAATYDQRRDEIGAEMFFLIRQVKENLGK